MTDAETTRVRAWAEELRAVHERLREALEVTREQAVAGDATRAVGADLLLFCHGFCAALAGHQEGEDRALFPALGPPRTPSPGRPWRNCCSTSTASAP